jgi:hypothetical protein
MNDHERYGGTGHQEGDHQPTTNHSPNEDGSHQHSGGRMKTYVIAIGVLLVVIIVVNATLNKEEVNQSVEPSRDDNIVVTIDDGLDEEAATVELNEFMEGYGINTFADLDEASLSINSAQGRPTSGAGSEQLIASVVSSDLENMVYFATKSYDASLNEVFNGIYHYNTVTNRWQRIYKNSVVGEESEPPSYLRVIARAGAQLVLFRDNQANTLGQCDSWWLLSDREEFDLLLLNLEDPYAGFVEFELPDQLRTKAQTERNSCLTS